MELIIDTNKILSSTIKQGKARRLVILTDIKFYTPDKAFAEIKKHGEDLCREKHLDPDVFKFILEHIIKPRIESTKIKTKFLKRAEKVASKFDVDDAPFIALAMQLNVPIWSNDKKLITHGLKTREYVALDTKAVEELLLGKPLEEVLKNLKRRLQI